MEHVKKIIREELLQVLGCAYGTSDSMDVDQFVERLTNRLGESCTDLTNPNDYENVCAYCSRPAENIYG